mmetsp:Transcript_73898/g.193833  ORF Transcript_73898/g.193833 Transcript_73898/m.193833 type:complete len:626 (+) Transcript_73898:367-2244(+)
MLYALRHVTPRQRSFALASQRLLLGFHRRHHVSLRLLLGGPVGHGRLRDELRLLQPDVDDKEDRQDAVGDGEAEAVVPPAVRALLRLDGDGQLRQLVRVLGDELRPGGVVAVHDAEHREGAGDRGVDEAALEADVDEVGHNLGQDPGDDDAAAGGHVLDLHAAVAGVEAAVVVNDDHDAEAQRGVVAVGRVLEGLLRDQEADSNEDEADGHWVNQGEDAREETCQHHDKVDDAVRNGVAARGTHLLVPGVPDVRGGRQDGPEQCSEAGPGPVHDHRLHHRVVVANRARRLHQLHGLDERLQSEGGQDRHNDADVRKALEDDEGDRPDLADVIAGVLQSFFHDVVVGVVLANARPLGDAADHDDEERRREPAVDALAVVREEAQEAEGKGQDGDDRLLSELEQRAQGEPHEADGGDGRVDRGLGHVLADEVADEAPGHLQQAGHEAAHGGRAPDPVCEHVRRHAGLEGKLEAEGQEHAEGDREANGRVDAVGDRGDVGAVLVPGQLPGHPPVPDVAEDQREADAGADLLVDHLHVGGLEVGGNAGAAPDAGNGPGHRPDDADEGGEVVQEEHGQRLDVALAEPGVLRVHLLQEGDLAIALRHGCKSRRSGANALGGQGGGTGELDS